VKSKLDIFASDRKPTTRTTATITSNITRPDRTIQPTVDHGVNSQSS
jgi:hypothetical protein